jgi:hypothetical protein
MNRGSRRANGRPEAFTIAPAGTRVISPSTRASTARPNVRRALARSVMVDDSHVLVPRTRFVAGTETVPIGLAAHGAACAVRRPDDF